MAQLIPATEGKGFRGRCDVIVGRSWQILIFSWSRNRWLLKTGALL